MFTSLVTQLRSVQRFDSVVNSKDLAIGEVFADDGGSQLAIKSPDGSVFTMEERAQAQFLSQWGIPKDHFDRLPREIQATELTHFTQKQPRSITIRAIHDPAHKNSAARARAVLSGRYSPYDSHEVLEAVAPHLEGWDITRTGVTRDEMAIVATLPAEYRVGPRQVNDVVKAGVVLRNSEVGTMALGVEVTLWRLKCLNGMIGVDAGITVRQRHIYVSRSAFERQLRDALVSVPSMGALLAQRLQKAHELPLPNLDPFAGKLQAAIVHILRREGLWTKEFQRSATEALGGTESADLFGLVQHITDHFAKDASVADRVHRERVAGRLLALVE